MMFKAMIDGEEVKVGHLMTAVGQVVAYDWARAVLYSLGCGLRREENYLQVFMRSNKTCYVNAPDDEECEKIGSLYVDEGWWTNTQEFGGEGKPSSSPWREYVDCVDLLAIVLRKLDADKADECHSGGFMGAGFRQQHMAKMVIERLREIGYLPMEEEKEQMEVNDAVG